MDTVSKMMAYEEGELDITEATELFQELLDTGIIYSLQGSYQRTMAMFIRQGLVTL